MEFEIDSYAELARPHRMQEGQGLYITKFHSEAYVGYKNAV